VYLLGQIVTYCLWSSRHIPGALLDNVNWYTCLSKLVLWNIEDLNEFAKLVCFDNWIMLYFSNKNKTSFIHVAQIHDINSYKLSANNIIYMYIDYTRLGQLDWMPYLLRNPLTTIPTSTISCFPFTATLYPGLWLSGVWGFSGPQMNILYALFAEDSNSFLFIQCRKLTATDLHW
jgi:hypothetical protein